jgi:peptide/nickel transport system substrate-binding protein
MSRVRGIAAVTSVAAALLVGLGGCGGGGGEGGTIIRGTIDQPVSYDPSGAYDLPSYDVLTNVYQNLLTIPPGGTKPEPEAAESCDFTDNKNTTFECTLKDGLKFSDGSPLTAKDVKFSFDRNIEIASPTGASSLLTNLKSTEAPDDKTVIFHLKEPDVTFPQLLTAMSFAIVPADGPNAFPADKLEPSDKVIGSGRYTVAAYEPGQQTVLEKNDNYTGDDPAENDRAIIQYFDKSSALKLAVEQGDVDLAYRNLSPTEYDDLKQSGDVNVIGGKGVEIRYLVFNQDLQPGDNDAQKLAIRRAVAYTIDRDAIVNDVYDGTVQPLYSMIPQGLDYAGEPYKDEYGASPDVDAAKAELQKAGVKTPVDLEIWYTPSHYGPVSADEYAEIKHQLDDTGLFTVTLKSSEWTQYSEAYATDKYPQHQLGFFPDYPDPDDYAYNLWGSQSFLNDHYSNPQVDKLLAQERATSDPDTRAKAFAQLQKLAAADAPTIPYWQGGQTAAVRDNIHGVEETFDPAFLFRFWVVTKD